MSKVTDKVARPAQAASLLSAHLAYTSTILAGAGILSTYALHTAHLKLIFRSNILYLALAEFMFFIVMPSLRPLTDTSWMYLPCSSYHIMAVNQQHQATY